MDCVDEPPCRKQAPFAVWVAPAATAVGVQLAFEKDHFAMLQNSYIADCGKLGFKCGVKGPAPVYSPNSFTLIADVLVALWAPGAFARPGRISDNDALAMRAFCGGGFEKLWQSWNTG